MGGQQRVGLVSRRLLLGVRRGCYAQGSSVLAFANRHHGTTFSSSVSSSLTRLLLDREAASTSNRGEAWKWYACGPTVYDSAHLGHARTYVCQDIIRRVLTNHFRQDVMFAMGVTDVDDKILRRAAEMYERACGWNSICFTPIPMLSSPCHKFTSHPSPPTNLLNVAKKTPGP
jgi:cysteinyl-tRNA synthetase